MTFHPGECLKNTLESLQHRQPSVDKHNIMPPHGGLGEAVLAPNGPFMCAVTTRAPPS